MGNSAPRGLKAAQTQARGAKKKSKFRIRTQEVIENKAQSQKENPRPTRAKPENTQK
jgi:hypothetical protein